jgi:type VII secretion integral membrane protein EccD
MTHMRADGLDHDVRRAGIVRAPDLCRLTILAARTQVDLAVPLNVPVALLIPGIVDMVVAHVRNNEFDAGDEQVEPREWVLARVGSPPLSSTLSLGEQGVRDGELLMLESSDNTAPPPLFDDIMYNVAMVDADRYRRWSPTVARWMGSLLAVAATLAGCFALLWSSWQTHPDGSDHLLGGVVSASFAVLLLAAAVALSRIYHDSRTAVVLGTCTLPSAFSAGVLFVPREWSWSQVLVGAAMTGAFAVLALRLTGVGLGLFTGAAMVSLFLLPAAVAGMFITEPNRVVYAVLAAAALGALGLAPRLSMALARLPLPPVPTGGSAVDPSEADPTDLQAMPSFDELNAKARSARQYLAGVVGGATLLATGGGLGAAMPTGHNWSVYWPGAVLALVIGIVLLFRGRTYANAEDAVTLFGGGAVVLIALLVGTGMVNDKYALGVFAVGVLVGMIALAVGVVAPHHSATPPVRRTIELLEYGFVAAVLPLVCWVANLYSTMRGL